ncbi:hypothetical protein APA_1656 [Pseudanabaena sp. lw0831]|nr:hypothetical protein APA_1656 [Pseudanabaena sp. lw0831]
MYSYSKSSQVIKPKRELRRGAPQLSFGFWLGIKRHKVLLFLNSYFNSKAMNY